MCGVGGPLLKGCGAHGFGLVVFPSPGKLSRVVDCEDNIVSQCEGSSDEEVSFSLTGAEIRCSSETGPVSSVSSSEGGFRCPLLIRGAVTIVFGSSVSSLWYNGLRPA